MHEFDLPDLDASAVVEVGVILLGLDPERLLTGLGLVALTDDPGRVAVTVDRLHHGAPAVDAGLLVAEGARYWTSMRPALARACPDPPASPALRRSFERVHRALDPAAIGAVGPATRAYLTACWLRRADVDRAADPIPHGGSS